MGSLSIIGFGSRYKMRAEQPFLKWAGGKRWLWPHVMPLLPNNFRLYIEPFLGSGAIYFKTKPKKAVLSDVNPWLIETFNAIKFHPLEVRDRLLFHSENHSQKYYYEIRSKNFTNCIDRSAQLIYLNQTCWNALFRVNKNGKFNVPIGSKSSVTPTSDEFIAWSQSLSGADISVRDFEETLAIASDGDIVFADPPYVTTHSQNGFLKYNEHIFSWSDQIRLMQASISARERGATVIITNAPHVSVKELYGEDNVLQYEISRSSVIAGASHKRGQVDELMIILRPR